ncbi:hypothetical protein PL75_06550 [Neisseria arctica]|uniref:HTH lysR-type domain-containing protein n=1 Tax=Neisseria arctica TaxID=1470200 RepID=A0A0J0YRI1_9NEIS|nr:LysR family transcriptional regulator [Neisseria arctica]KLT72734.1 hypothetical protein PL75_06550 [Neisseria arctica]UOO87229.1 LysR substrate-binding domain-containing protein [Neisseria arctica]
MDLNAVKMFIALVQAGSFSGCSTKTGIPIATLSRKIKELERYLSVQLIERSRQGIRLTSSGQQLVEQAGESIESLSTVEQYIRNSQQKLTGKLRLSMPQAFELWWALLHDFQLAYPDIDVHVAANNRKLDLIADGIDVAVRVGAVGVENMVAKKVMELEMRLVAGKTFTARYGMPDSIDRLLDFPLACNAEAADKQAEWRLGGEILVVKPHFATNDYFHLRYWALLGNGICELPAMLADSFIRSGELVIVLPEQALPKQNIHLVYPSHRHPSSIVRVYIDFCVTWLQQHDMVGQATLQGIPLRLGLG